MSAHGVIQDRRHPKLSIQCFTKFTTLPQLFIRFLPNSTLLTLKPTLFVVFLYIIMLKLFQIGKNLSQPKKMLY